MTSPRPLYKFSLRLELLSIVNPKNNSSSNCRVSYGSIDKVAVDLKEGFRLHLVTEVDLWDVGTYPIKVVEGLVVQTASIPLIMVTNTGRGLRGVE